MQVSVHIMTASTPITKNYVYLVADEKSKKAVLVDPVWEKSMVVEVMEEKGITLTHILLTHSHPDHVFLADSLARDTGCIVHMSQIEIDYYNFNCHNLVPLNNNEQFFCGNTLITPILTPGHTKGSLCYMIGNNLFTGDTLFIEGCGLCWGKGADPEEMFESLQMLKQIIPGQMKIYPGHRFGVKPGLQFENVLQYNIYLDFKKKEEFIKYRMRKNQHLLFAFK
ncbi:MAG: MBL fold metallo-hydrolase [Spirochaetales bacterium]|nr:MBL fold metallo-hydrolase [Spirochaetales bacterium]